MCERKCAVKRSFRLGPNPKFALTVEFYVDHVGMTADGAIFDVLLALACRKVERDDDFLATRVADVGSFVLHCRLFTVRGHFSWGDHWHDT